MKSYSALPPGYAAYATLDLLNNKKQFYIVNGISIGLAVLLVILPFLWGWSPESSDGFGLFFVRVLVFFLGTRTNPWPCDESLWGPGTLWL